MQPADGGANKTPVVFFHQASKSALDHKPLLLEMGTDRLVLAPDTPGYGGSDRPPTLPDMSDIAGAMADGLDNLGYGTKGLGKVDVFGFHTGVFIAAELVLQRPDLVRRVVLSGITYMSPTIRKERYDAMPAEYKIDEPRTQEDGTRIQTMWNRVVQKRDPSITIDRAVEIFIGDVQALDSFWYTFSAVTKYPIEERFPLIKQPVLVLQPHEMLLEETRAAKRELLPNADLIEIPEVKTHVFDTGAKQYAKHMRSWLDKEI